MKMKEDKILVDIYKDEFDGEMKVNIGHSTYEENITISLGQAVELMNDLRAKIAGHFVRVNRP